MCLGTTTKVVVATAEPEKPLPLSVITDGKAREARIRDVFGQLFWYWDKDRDGWLTQADWAANNQAGQASDSAWIEMTRSSARAPNAIDKETFLDFYIQFYLPKGEEEYRMFLDHWGAAATALKKAWEKEAEKMHKTSDVGGGRGGDLGRASNGYQPAARSGGGGSGGGGVATPGTVPPSATGNGPVAATTASATPTAHASGTPSAAQTATAPTTSTATVSTGLPIASATPAPIAFVMPPI